jgi:chromosomal replication initiator protein
MLSSPYVYPGIRDIDAKQTSVFDVVLKVCDIYGITLDKLMTRTRFKPIPEARHICMFIMRRQFKWGFIKIGEYFNLDHTTVIHGVQGIEKLLDTNYFNNTRIYDFLKKYL